MNFKKIMEVIGFVYGDCNCDQETVCNYCKAHQEIKEIFTPKLEDCECGEVKETK